MEGIFVCFILLFWSIYIYIYLSSWYILIYTCLIYFPYFTSQIVDSIKTMSMEDVSTKVLEKIKKNTQKRACLIFTSSLHWPNQYYFRNYTEMSRFSFVLFILMSTSSNTDDRNPFINSVNIDITSSPGWHGQSYDVRKWSSTLWPDGYIRLFAHYTTSLPSLCRPIWRHWTAKMLVRYIVSRVCVKD